MTQGAYLTLDHETVKVEADGKMQLQVPLHHLGGIVTMGNVLVSPFLLGKCAEDGRAVVILDRNGRYQCRMVGKTSGNVLLRKAQYDCLGADGKSVRIARNIVAGKIRNSRHSLLRSAREADDGNVEASLRKAADLLGNALFRLENVGDIDTVRGLEGEAASAYFAVFDLMIKEEGRTVFALKERTRRPPRDPINALLSFLYTLLLNDCISAAEGVGLDSQMGFLHALRPGRPSLGLDLMEELRAVLADRLTITLINRKQLTGEDFENRPGGAVYLNERGRKEVVTAYQKRKQDEIHHPLMKEKVPIGLVPHLQARLLARHIRGDMEEYVPFIYL